MRRFFQLKGVLAPLLTPLFPTGELDREGFKGAARMLLDAPSVGGLFALGASGEYMYLSFEEKKTLMGDLVEVMEIGDLVVVNTGGEDREEMFQLTEHAIELGLPIVAILLTSTEKNLETLSLVRDIHSLGHPFMVYYPPRRPQGPDLNLLREMMRFDTLVGLKDSSRDLEFFTKACALYGQEISIFQGVEMLHLPSLACGSAGIIGGGANIYPALLERITETFEEHDLLKARQLQQEASDNWSYLSRDGNFRWVLKRVWRELGIIGGDFCRDGQRREVADKQLLRVGEMIDYEIPGEEE